MHIPDGYLSPQTYVPLYVVSIGIITVSINNVKKDLSAKTVPFLGMSAAFAFLIMMFNIPIPGGTSGHAVGAALIALLFGPWIATISVTVALIIQAFVFGDGGITALGANCFNMAIAMPLAAYGLFRLIRGRSINPRRITIAAFLAGYFSLSFAAILAGVEFGIQPLIAASPDGTPLYAPYPLKIAVPVMAIEHLLIFGIIEGVVTALLFRYFYKINKEMIEVLR
jgi:cobalt/nickel transport system permease protein